MKMIRFIVDVEVAKTIIWVIVQYLKTLEVKGEYDEEKVEILLEILNQLGKLIRDVEGENSSV